MSDYYTHQTPTPDFGADVRTNLQMMSSPNASVAFFGVTIPGLVSQTYAGDAKRHPKDRPDTTIGGLLAASRALKKAAGDLEAMAYERIEERERDLEAIRQAAGRFEALTRAMGGVSAAPPATAEELDERADAAREDLRRAAFPAGRNAGRAEFGDFSG